VFVCESSGFSCVMASKPWFLYPYVYFVGNCVFFVYFLVFFFVCYVCVDIELYCAGWICDC
jgi:hypothetical protein